MPTARDAPTDLCSLSIQEARVLLGLKKVSPVEFTDASLKRISTIDRKLHAFITVTADVARDQARLSEARHMNGAPSGPSMAFRLR
jgi:aspartyl-tRNA(Asn)/glutamyl-tRNA(Gln) amidotransferase subunit A